MRVPLVSLKTDNSGVLEVVEEEKKEKKNKSCPVFKGVRDEKDEEVFREMASWPAVATAWSG